MTGAKALFLDPSVLELMPTAVYIIDVHGLICGYNQLACEFWGRTPKLRDHDDLFCGAFRLYNPDGTHLPRDKTPMSAAVDMGISCKNAEVVILRPDGSEITVMVNITPLWDENGVVIGAINAFQDISEIVESRRKIESHRFELERRDSFLSICSHELKTPLSVLMSQAQLALRKIKLHDDSVFDHDRVRWMIEQNTRQFDRLNRLVDDMLDLHRIKSGSLTMRFEQAELGPLVKDVVANTVYGLDQSKRKVTVHATGPHPGVFDRDRIEQVVTNLVVNAIKYGADGPIDVEVVEVVEVAEASEQSGKVVRILVRDQGRGIAPKDLERIFERYERAEEVAKTSGLGLGLFVTRQIVEAHRGRIYAQSELGKGSTFVVELPLLPPTPAFGCESKRA
jgi:signal transduction histidine kinase